jgi:hypothetical protein
MYSGNIDPAMLSKLIPAFEGLEYMGEGIRGIYGGGSAEDAAQRKQCL